MPLANRKKSTRKRHPQDFYPTEIGVCRAALTLIKTSIISTIIDPGAGTGVWGQAAREKYANRAKIWGVELRDVPPSEYYDTWLQSDFMTAELPHADLVIGNPPYKFAEQFVRKSIELVSRNAGYVLLLLPWNFCGGQDRRTGLWARYKPTAVYVMSRRPSFTGDKKTDMTEYGLYLWDLGKTVKDPALRYFDWKDVLAEQNRRRLF